MSENKSELIIPKGKPGRRPGSKNKATRDMRSKYGRFLEMSFKDIMKHYKGLGIADKIKLHNQVANLIVPKASVSKQEVTNVNGADNTPITFTLQLNDSNEAIARLKPSPEALEDIRMELEADKEAASTQPVKAVPLDPFTPAANRNDGWDNFLGVTGGGDRVGERTQEYLENY